MNSYRRLFQTFPSFLSALNVQTNQVALAHTIKIKRQWPVPLPKLDKAAILKTSHSVFKVVKIENGPKELAVILTEDSSDFGIRGEMVTLPKRFSRRLIYSGKAVYASPENIAEYAAREGTSQTLSGRRMALWLKEHDIFNCHLPSTVSWILTPEILARCLLKEHDVTVPPAAISLPDYPITSDNNEKSQEHQVYISINQSEPVPITISINERLPS